MLVDLYIKSNSNKVGSVNIITTFLLLSIFFIPFTLGGIDISSINDELNYIKNVLNGTIEDATSAVDQFKANMDNLQNFTDNLNPLVNGNKEN